MDIKNLKPNKNALTKQGYYPIHECKKYSGSGPIIYRSSWEKLFCDFCEKSKEIVSWSSESVAIPYFDTISETKKRYFPDFLVKTKSGLTILIEVKPESHLKFPTEPKRLGTKKHERFIKLSKIVQTNLNKFKQAMIFCADKGWVFRIITEKFIGKLK